MGKITIKHFLNTNLKPYIINKEKYYTVYLLITAQRKTTKVKSIEFDEYYTEKIFDDIFNSNDPEDKKMIQNEICSVNIMSELVLNELNEFDTNFLTAYYNFSNQIDIWKIDNERFIEGKKEVNFYNELKNAAGINLETIKNKLTNFRSITLYEFFNELHQYKVENLLKEQKVKNYKEVLHDINRTFFFVSMDYFRWYIEGNKKNAVLTTKFEQFFDTYTTLINSYIVQKYKV